MSALAEKIKNTEHQGEGKTLLDMIGDMTPEFEKALPMHFSAERFARVALTTMRTTPRLLECSVESVLGGFMQAAQLGLEISGVRGQAYLIPRKRNGRPEASFQLGYKGMIDLAGRGGVTVNAMEVAQSDEFDYRYGTESFLHHRPQLDSSGPTIAFYSVAAFADGRYPQFTVMSLRQMEKHRDKYRSDKRNNSTWDTDFEAMGRKTVIRRLLNLLPLPVEASVGISADNRVILSSPAKPSEIEIVEYEEPDDSD